MSEASRPAAGRVLWGARLLGSEGARLVLASASPRRAALLTSIGVPFETVPVDVLEDLRPNETPAAAARRLAEEKARAAASAMRTAGPVAAAIRATSSPAATGVHGDEETLIVGADTLVVADGVALGKPRDAADARRMLRLLSGRSHEVVTGVAVLRTSDGFVACDVAVTAVRFRVLDVADVDALVDSGDATDKAGAYGIQGLAALAVDGIEGDYFNVVGLPLGLLRQLILRARSAGRIAKL